MNIQKVRIIDPESEYFGQEADVIGVQHDFDNQISSILCVIDHKEIEFRPGDVQTNLKQKLTTQLGFYF